MVNKMVRVFFQFCITGVTLLLFTTACTVPFLEQEKPHEIQADCFTNFYLSAWIDTDADGIWDISESPLEGVEFRIDGQFASMLSDYPCISNGDGKCTITTWTPGECEPRDYKIMITPPDSYQPTIPASIYYPLTMIDFSRDIQFGFISD